jgi:hypothetical protein
MIGDRVDDAIGIGRQADIARHIPDEPAQVQRQEFVQIDGGHLPFVQRREHLGRDQRDARRSFAPEQIRDQGASSTLLEQQQQI